MWTAARVLERIALGEDSQVEFKEVRFANARVTAPTRRSLADEMAALANTVGGTLIFSISDSRDVRPVTPQEIDALERYVTEICRDNVAPALPITTEKVALPDSGPVLVIEVRRGAAVHRSPGGYMHRHGSEKRQISPDELERLFQRRGRSGRLGPDETLVAGAGRNTLDAALVDRLSSSRSTEPTDVQLEKLGLVREDDNGVARATVAGVLLCTERPDLYVRGATIEAVRYAGTVLGAADQLDAATIVGPLDRQIRDAVGFVARNMRVAARKAPARMETPQFDPRAVFEAIVNAVVHRDYAIENARTRLFMFDDRMQLHSPGALPNTLSVEAMRDRQATRNETLASMFRRLPVEGIVGAGDRAYFMEQRGEGVPVIHERTSALTGREPVYELLDGAELRLTIPAALPPVADLEGEVVVFSAGRPLQGATVVVLYPNKTWIRRTTDAFGRAAFDFHRKLPMTVLCAAPDHAARAVHGWMPPEELAVELQPLPRGGSTVFAEGTGYLPRLTGRLNPILDNLDRMYLYASNIAIDEGKQQPVHFKLGQQLRLTDVDGREWIVRFIEMIGTSALLEYRAPGASG